MRPAIFPWCSKGIIALCSILLPIHDPFWGIHGVPQTVSINIWQMVFDWLFGWLQHPWNWDISKWKISKPVIFRHRVMGLKPWNQSFELNSNGFNSFWTPPCQPCRHAIPFFNLEPWVTLKHLFMFCCEKLDACNFSSWTIGHLRFV